MAFNSPTLTEHVAMEYLVDIAHAMYRDIPSLPKPGDLVSYKRTWQATVAGILLIDRDYRYAVEWYDVKGAQHAACVPLMDLILLDRREDR